MCVDEREAGRTVKLQGHKGYGLQVLGVKCSGKECGKEVKKKVQTGWSGRGKVSGVVCDKRVASKVKGNI